MAAFVPLAPLVGKLTFGLAGLFGGVTVSSEAEAKHAEARQVVSAIRSSLASGESDPDVLQGFLSAIAASEAKKSVPCGVSKTQPVGKYSSFCVDYPQLKAEIAARLQASGSGRVVKWGIYAAAGLAVLGVAWLLFRKRGA